MIICLIFIKKISKYNFFKTILLSSVPLLFIFTLNIYTKLVLNEILVTYFELNEN
jgi:hypothetical protein